MWDHRHNSVHIPLVKLLIPFTETGGEEMVVPTIQLFWIALITELLLLLIPLITLLIVTTLVTVTLNRRLHDPDHENRTLIRHLGHGGAGWILESFSLCCNPSMNE